MISPEDDYFAGEPDAGFLILHDPINGFNLVDVRRITPPKRVIVSDCQRIENYQHRVVGPVGGERRAVQTWPILNHRVEHKIGKDSSPAYVWGGGYAPLDRLHHATI